MEIKNRQTVRTLESNTLRELQANLLGRAISPDQPDYEEVRRIWNGYIDRYPAVIVRCLDANDVAQAIRFARSNDLQIAVRGGGHSFPGYSTIDDGLVIDLSAMKDVLVDPDRRTALVSPGVKLGELIHATERYGLVTPVGTASDTGIAGLTLGGGFGYLSGKYGLSCDNVLSYTMVTAEGTIVRASAAENADLYWGLRGGGGNFGVVTSFEFQLHPQGKLLSGMLLYPMDKGVEVLEYHREFTDQLPDELAVAASFITSPEGHPLVGLVPCYSGDMQVGERIFEPLRKFGSPLADLIRPMSYLEVVEMLDPAFPTGRNYYDKGSTLPSMTDEVINLAVDAAASRTSPFSAIAFFMMHGAAARVPLESTAYPVREKSYTPVIIGAWEEGPAEPHIDWVRKTYADIKQHSIEETYVNFISEEEQHLMKSVYGQNYERLLEIKRCYDPDNVFRRNANINPIG